jgi:hypothetical protein
MDSSLSLSRAHTHPHTSRPCTVHFKKSTNDTKPERASLPWTRSESPLAAGSAVRIDPFNALTSPRGGTEEAKRDEQKDGADGTLLPSFDFVEANLDLEPRNGQQLQFPMAFIPDICHPRRAPVS